MRPDLALTAIDAVRADHAHGHTCSDGKWYNPHAGTRTRCQTAVHLDTASNQVTLLGTQVQVAATQTRHIDAVAAALVATPLAELSPDNQEAWRGLARQGIEALAWSLENNDQLTQRAQALTERLAADPVVLHDPGPRPAHHPCANPHPTTPAITCTQAEDHRGMHASGQHVGLLW